MICCRKMLVFAGLMLAVSFSVSAKTHVPGLLGGYVANSGTSKINLTDYPAEPAVYLSPEAAATQSTKTHWANYRTWVYWGEMYFNGGTYHFAENIDDVAWLSIDGTVYMNNTAAGTSSKTGDIVLSAGWHTIEMRFGNGTGTAGPATARNGWTTTYAFGYNVDGADSVNGGDHTFPVDDGTMNLFRCTGAFYVTMDGEPTQIGTPDPAYGRCYLALDDVQLFTAPAPVTNFGTRIITACTGWRLTPLVGEPTTGPELEKSLTMTEGLHGATLTWLFAESPLPRAGYARFVVPSGTAGNTPTPPYNTWATAANDIPTAVEALPATGEIVLAPGTYPVTSDWTVATANLTVTGEDPATGLPACDSVILDGGYPARTNRIFYINAANVTLKGLTMRNAMLYRQNGGAVYVNATGFAMTNCVIRDSIAQYGAGLYAAEACHGIVDCVFTNNFASGFGSGYGFGAGAYFYKAATVRKCLFVEGEVMTEGGGCYCNGAFAFTDCTFTNNMTQTSGGNQKGGAFYCNGTAGAFTNCQFLGNYAKENGSACFLNKNAIFEKCRFVGNRGSGWGILYSGSNSQKIYNSYFSHNGGSSVSSIGVGGGSVVSNCVFENQTSTDAKGDRGVVGMPSGSGRINVTHCRFYNVYSSSFIDENTDINSCVFTNITMTFVFGRSTNKIRNSLFTGNLKPVLLANCTYENCSFVTNAAGPAVSLMNSNVTSPKLTNCVFWANSAYKGYYGNMGLLLAKSNDFDATNRVKMANCVLQSNTETSAKAPDMRLADKTGETARLTALAIAKGPRFVDPAKGDWRLKRNSPLRDAGVKHDWMATATDLDGNQRCLGANGKPAADALPDIGCYECDVPMPGMLLLIR